MQVCICYLFRIILCVGECKNCHRATSTVVCSLCRLRPQCRRCKRFLRREKFNSPDKMCDACHHKATSVSNMRYALDGNVEEHEIAVVRGDLDVPNLIRQNELDESIQRHGYAIFLLPNSLPCPSMRLILFAYL